ncbi:MAG: molecular chaperone HtpG [Verrucomicrobiales bacterium]|nr:molecular chaperone HtpG [Verrucomicrobiales bacterium]
MSDKNEKREFQADVSQVLDIVTNSLYTDKEIFVRELVSNASDALEKLRHLQLTEKEVFDDNLSLEIHITTNEEDKTFTIADYGIGMTREELHENLGTIAHSGSKQFVKALEEQAKKESSLIGQFGVGFYSAFMVADDVTVHTHSWQEDGEHLVWKSDGRTGYEIEESEGERRGTKIVVKLKEEFEEYAKADRIKHIIESYSAFVSFPILLNGERVNTVEAIWRKQKSEISDEEYNEFYKFTSKAFDDPRYRMHFSSDTPLELNALIFVPTENTELFGFGQMEAGVSLYCKNVLIDDKPDGLIPEWARFLRGVIDSSDIPLNISRESMQDSALVKKLNRVVIRKFLKFLDKEAKSDPEKYGEFYEKFSRFLKEGVVTDFEHREDLAKLLRFESSMTEKGESVGFEDYLSRAKDDQDKIYYLITPDRKTAEAGPYLEAFKARGLEVIYFYDAVDDYLIQNLRQFKDKDLVSIDRSDVELDDSVEAEGEALEESAIETLSSFMQEHFGDRVKKVAAGKRLIDSPVAVLTPDQGMSAQMRQMMKAMNPDEDAPPVEVEMEINPRHPLIKQLFDTQGENPELAQLVSDQLLDGALLTAGLLEDRKDLITRNISLMEAALRKS